LRALLPDSSALPLIKILRKYVGNKHLTRFEWPYQTSGAEMFFPLCPFTKDDRDNNFKQIKAFIRHQRDLSDIDIRNLLDMSNCSALSDYNVMPDAITMTSFGTSKWFKKSNTLRTTAE